MNIDLHIMGIRHLDPAKTGYQSPDINQRTVTGKSWRQLGTCQNRFLTKGSFTVLIQDKMFAINFVLDHHVFNSN